MVLKQDTTFFTNEPNNTLVDRFNILLNDTEFFDCLVGYFYVSGFYKLQKSLEHADKIRILVGMGIDSQTFKLIKDSEEMEISTAKFKENIKNDLVTEMDNSDNSINVEDGAKQFIEWLKTDKIEIKAYKERKTHSKLYIMTFPETDKDMGRVITGSSNFTQPGLEKNLEFNVELKDAVDYEFAKEKFEELWQHSEPITKDFINTLTKKTWLNENITPYELYLKFIYEYLYEKINNDKEELDTNIMLSNFKYLDYQRDAVLDAKQKVKEYGGVFLSDVVGLGKTYMGALLAQQLKGRTLVIAPPALVAKHNPGGWYRVMKELEVNSEVESKGKLEQIIKKYPSNYFHNIIIDESHDFRNEETQQYDDLKNICNGKNVILVSATPFNNSVFDLLGQILLFQSRHNSTLPNPKVKDLENYFKGLSKKQDSINKDDDPEKYLKMSKEISADIRENVLQYLMVRRTRNSISKYYANDLKKNKMEFPKVNKPIALYYKFDEYTNEVFDETLHILNEKIHYAKYRPLADEYQIKHNIKYTSSQRNFANFMKILLIKRLESGSYAFKKSIDNWIKIHKEALQLLNEKEVFYTSRDYNYKIFDMVMGEDVDKIEELISEGKVKEYNKGDFTEQFLNDLSEDLDTLNYVKDKWESIENYPKIEKLIELLNTDLKGKKVIIFSEFIDTVEYVGKLLLNECSDKVLIFSGNSSSKERDKVLYNFDANIPDMEQENEYDILVTTDALAHGVNLHRSNIIINFDIPWNPTKMMQRVGRVQRLDTDFNEIYTYNFFPTKQIEDNIKIKFYAEKKIAMFIELLGNDSQLLTDEPIQSYDLFNKLTSDFMSEEELVDDELKYLHLMRNIRDNDSNLFKRIEEIPKKARVGRKSNNKALISLLKTGKFKKVFKTTDGDTVEIDFFDAIKELEADKNEKNIGVDEDYYKYLHYNLNAFEEILNNPNDEIKLSRNEKEVLKYVNFSLQNKQDLTNFDHNLLIKVKELINDGHITKNKIKELKSKINGIKNTNNEKDFIESIIHILRKIISEEDLKTNTANKKENDENAQIILSEYFK